jgi:hypothetical protein
VSIGAYGGQGPEVLPKVNRQEPGRQPMAVCGQLRMSVQDWSSGRLASVAHSNPAACAHVRQ